jgi:hypothetical protein
LNASEAVYRSADEAYAAGNSALGWSLTEKAKSVGVRGVDMIHDGVQSGLAFVSAETGKLVAGDFSSVGGVARALPGIGSVLEVVDAAVACVITPLSR